jgi:hypothetical protein
MFSESDSDSEGVSDCNDYDERDSSIQRRLQELLQTPEISNESGDPTTTIVDRSCGKCYGLEKESKASKKFFNLINKLDSHELIIYEKQDDYRGGLMLDLDMYFKNSTVVVMPKHRKEFCKMVADLMFECFDVEKIHQAVIIKPLPMKNDKKILMNDTEKKCFKDGFHVLVPDVLMTKSMRRFFLSQIQLRLQGLESFKKLNFIGDILDQNSAFVGVHFIGCPSKKGKKAYTLENVFRCTKDAMKDIKRKVVQKCNVMLEFSVNEWGREQRITNKKRRSIMKLCRGLWNIWIKKMLKNKRRRKMNRNTPRLNNRKKKLRRINRDSLNTSRQWSQAFPMTLLTKAAHKDEAGIEFLVAFPT